MEIKKNGFTSLEYAFLIAILVAALIGMSLYFQRALSGKWRDAGDNLGFGRQVK
jgi:Flp pilus assembly pilin Flp